MRLLVTVFLTWLVGFGCKSDAQPKVVPASEHGRWKVTSAMRSGRVTKTLDAAYFSFDTTAHRFTTNFVGEEVNLDYDYKKDKGTFTTSGSALLETFIVESLTDTTLIISTEIRGTPFRFELAPEIVTESSEFSGDSL